jgi:hypothetical protein
MELLAPQAGVAPWQTPASTADAFVLMGSARQAQQFDPILQILPQPQHQLHGNIPAL